MNNIVSFDIETNGLDPREKNFLITGIGLFSKIGSKFYYMPSSSDLEEIISNLENRKIVGHNLIFDLNCIYVKFNYDLSSYVEHDTMIMAHLIDENLEQGLDFLAKHYLNMSKIEINKPHHELSKEELEEYCLRDVEITFKLCEHLLSNPNLPKDLYYKESMPLYREVTIPMKYKGLRINENYFKNLVESLEVSTKKLLTEINLAIYNDVEEVRNEILNSTYTTTKNSKYGKKAIELYGTHELPSNMEKELKKQLWMLDYPEKPFIFNIKSNDQLAWLLFKKYGETPIKTTSSGLPSVDSESLKNFSHIEIIEKFLHMRKEEKILNTYAKSILEKSHNGWIYPNMKQTGTTSGRYSSNSPNFQNLPSSDMRIKEGIVAPLGHSILVADFSALEPRCFAEVSNCEKLIEVYKKGEDLYSRIAIDVFGLEGVSALEEDENYLKKIDPSYRNIMKVVALAVVYGAGSGRLSKILNIDQVEAQNIIDKYLSMYPELVEYMNRQEEQALNKYEVSSKYGRTRHMGAMKNLNPENKEQYWELRKYLNLAKNHPIQALAAHITNHAAIKINKVLKEKGIKGQIVLQVHDSLVLYVEKKKVKEAFILLKDAMENNVITNGMRVPIKADPKICKKLSEEK